MCSNCGTETRNRKYCSNRCAAIVNNRIAPKRKRGVTQLCHCGNLTYGPTGKYCSLVCFQDARYERFIRKWLSGELTGLTASGSTATYVKRWLCKMQGNKCSQCGWAEVHSITGKVPIQLDHIDGDYKNCRPENVRLLCPNCHSLTPTFGNLNAGRGRSYRYKK